MRKGLRFLLLAVGFGLAAVAVALAVLRAAVRHEPQFYRQLQQADPQAQERASDAMLRQVTAVASDVNHAGRWVAQFTAEEINGWLAVDLVRNHSNAVPPEFRDPRVSIHPGEVIVACRYKTAWLESLVWVVVEPYLADRGAIAIRIRKARAGRLPLPLRPITDGLTEAARRNRLLLEWQQSGGDPVALFRLPAPRANQRHSVHIDALKLEEGKLTVAGTTR